ncbi:hypothetical protein Tsubulata_011916, partial [Turnera subulata]
MVHTFKKPRRPYEKERLDAELKLVGEYGLRCKRELWRVQYALSRIRNNARMLLTLDEKNPRRIFEGDALLRRMNRYGLLDESQNKLDYVLALTVENFLERRLQTLVFKAGMAKSIHHARVLIRQKHIRVGRQVVNIPSFMVRVDSQKHIDFSLSSPLGGGRPGRNRGCIFWHLQSMISHILALTPMKNINLNSSGSMESINVFKGYDKVNSSLSVEEQQALHQQRKRRRTRIIIFFTISAIVFLTLVIGVLLASLIHESNNESPDESPSLSSNSAESIKAVCSVTQYPTSCFTSISSLNASTKPDPETIFNLSLQASAKELKNLSSFLASVNDVSSRAALDDCATQLEDALGRVNDSAALMVAAPGEKLLTVEKAKDIQTWISAAMTDQETCLEGLQEMGSSVLDEVKGKMEKSKELLSNSLAIIAKMQDLLD